jgi:hypothetical protein
MVTVGGGSGSVGKMMLAAVEVIYLAGICYYRPYLIGMHNVCLVINQSIVVLFTAFLVLNDFSGFLHDFRGYIMLGIELLLVVVNVLGCVRIYVHHKYNVKAF